MGKKNISQVTLIFCNHQIKTEPWSNIMPSLHLQSAQNYKSSGSEKKSNLFILLHYFKSLGIHMKYQQCSLMQIYLEVSPWQCIRGQT